MSCSCQSSPCTCPKLECPTPPTTKCDRYRPGMKNVWVEHGVNPGDENSIGVCMLDTMCDAQIIYTLERDDQARADLLTITSDPHLLEMARTIPRLPVVEDMDAQQAEFNRQNDSAATPFYAIFRGQPPFAQ